MSLESRIVSVIQAIGADIKALMASISGKQNALGFTPENSSNKGQPNGYPSLDSTGKIPSTQLNMSAAGVSTFNTRSGAVTLSQADVNDALGYTPAQTSHTHTLSYGDGATTKITVGTNETLHVTSGKGIVITYDDVNNVIQCSIKPGITWSDLS